MIFYYFCLFFFKQEDSLPPSDEENRGISLAAITPDDSTLAPATALDTSMIPDVLTQGERFQRAYSHNMKGISI